MNPQVHKAIDLAMQAHKGQLRKSGEPYIEHPLSVLSILLQTGVHLPLPAYLAAVLHDTLEDTTLTYESLEGQCGKETADIVLALTKVERPQGISARNHVKQYVQDMRYASYAYPEILLIKMADCIHNLDTIHGHAGRKRIEIIAEVCDLYYPMFKDCLPPAMHALRVCYERLLMTLRTSLERAFRTHDIRISLD
jgi:(p)ppGpp synthase/HD superfamily hydrolase